MHRVVAIRTGPVRYPATNWSDSELIADVAPSESRSERYNTGIPVIYFTM